MTNRTLEIDLDAGVVRIRGGAGEAREHSLGSAEGFAAVSEAWLRAGWDAKHVYSFTWMGRPIIQLPEDLVRLQELIHRVQPDVILETGVAHGGSLIFYASLCKAMDRGRVIGVDIEIRPSNRAAIEAHPLASLITLVEGDSVSPEIVAEAGRDIGPTETVLVLLDSAHHKDHVRAELEMYGPLVSTGSYIVAMDGIMGQLVGAPRSNTDWAWNNPREAAREFVSRHPEFVIDEPPFAFNEGSVDSRVTYWPDAFLRRVS
jgi:cephalosporin hydroxylase